MSYVSDNTFGTLSSAPNGSIIDHIYDYIISVLHDFTGTSDENENAITNRLCKTLEFKKPAACSYFFHHQNLEDDKENTSTDFAAFATLAYAMENSSNNSEPPPLIKFEAKRLNTTLPKKREQEYVIGEYENGVRIKNSGGIERFKNERHGKDVGHAGMIGYIQTDSFTYWLDKINGWIQNEINHPNDSNLSWGSDDILISHNEGDKVSCYSSRTKRLSNGSLQLRHLWINCN